MFITYFHHMMNTILKHRQSKKVIISENLMCFNCPSCFNVKTTLRETFAQNQFFKLQIAKRSIDYNYKQKSYL